VQGTDSPIGFFIAAALALAGYVGVVWLFGVRSGALTWRGLGLPDRPSLGRLLGDIGVGSGFLLVVAVTASLLGGLLARFLDTSAPEVVPPPDTPAGILLVALGAVVLIPIGEELFFRGYSLTAWRQDIGERSALLRSTLFFALVHIGTLTSFTFEAGARQALLVVVVIAPVGYALGWLFLRRGLVAAIAGHAAFNGFAILVTVLAQQLPAPGT
jgi:membrane protease YdiL (CAAX protease family)